MSRQILSKIVLRNRPVTYNHLLLFDFRENNNWYLFVVLKCEWKPSSHFDRRTFAYTAWSNFCIPKMADLSLTSMTPDQLRLEVDRLQRELDQTSSEKIQSAQYGLVLLEEKEQLEIRCEELETLFDTTKNELDVTQEALAKFQSNQQVSMQKSRAR